MESSEGLIYDPIDSLNGEIRLLDVLSETDDNGIWQCRFKTTKLPQNFYPRVDEGPMDDLPREPLSINMLSLETMPDGKLSSSTTSTDQLSERKDDDRPSMVESLDDYFPETKMRTEDFDYAALSYEWNPDWLNEWIEQNRPSWGSCDQDDHFRVETTGTIRFEKGGEITIKPNLRLFLDQWCQIRSNSASHPQRFSVPKYLWIDALCINQADDTEKGHQVEFMSRVYDNATRIFAWIGPSQDSSGKAIDTIRRQLEKMRHTETTRMNRSKDNAADWAFILKFITTQVIGMAIWERKGLESLIKRSYWTRGWIIQEISRRRNTHKVYYICGPHHIKYEDVEAFVQRFQWFTTVPSIFEKKWGKLPKLLSKPLHASWSIIHAMLRSGTEKLWGSYVPVISIRDDSEEIKDYMRGLLPLLVRHRYAKTEKPVDKIYSLLALIPEEDRAKIHVEYDEKKMSWKELYTNTTSSMIKDPKSADVLLCSGSNVSDMPSWVPDWFNEQVHDYNSPGTAYLNIFGTRDGTVSTPPDLIFYLDRGAGSTFTLGSLEVQGQVLHAKAKRVGLVEQVMMPSSEKPIIADFFAGFVTNADPTRIYERIEFLARAGGGIQNGEQFPRNLSLAASLIWDYLRITSIDGMARWLSGPVDFTNIDAVSEALQKAQRDFITDFRSYAILDKKPSRRAIVHASAYRYVTMWNKIVHRHVFTCELPPAVIKAQVDSPPMTFNWPILSYPGSAHASHRSTTHRIHYQPDRFNDEGNMLIPFYTPCFSRVRPSEGDEIFVLPNVSAPLILRKLADEGGNIYRVVGAAYVGGVMNGEASRTAQFPEGLRYCLPTMDIQVR